MAKKNNNKKKKGPAKKDEKVIEDVPMSYRNRAILGVLGIVLTLTLVLARIGLSDGVAGEFIQIYTDKLLGHGYVFLPLVTLLGSILLLRRSDIGINGVRALGLFLFLVSTIGLIDSLPFSNAGIIGGLIAGPLMTLFDFYITVIILFGLTIISLILSFDIHPVDAWKKIQELMARPEREEEEESEEYLVEGEAYEEEYEEELEALPLTETTPGLSALEKAKQVAAQVKEQIVNTSKPTPTEKPKKKEGIVIAPPRLGAVFTPPPIDLLSAEVTLAKVGDVKANSNLIKRTLKNFSIPVEIDHVRTGPSVTRYALKVAEGVKLNKIENLSKEIQASLAASTVRIEAPIAGTSLVGIEVPNIKKATVTAGQLLSDKEFLESDKPLLCTLGKTISGEAYYTDIARMPHLLVAGATGSGKSVTVHMLIMSLLYRNSPENLKMIMIDPKQVELTAYEGIPHLLTPVITSPKKAIISLKWAVNEMERRYTVLRENRQRNIEDYHAKILKPALKKAEKKNSTDDLPESMPYIVILVDELADLMQSFPKELEASIVRLAAKSRAVGIHLILSTQRPSTDVVTGLIKANIPSRIALRVMNMTDSRIILDQGGAEKLLGQGDMLFLGQGMPKPLRMQSSYISDDEIFRVVDWINEHYKDQLPVDISLNNDSVKIENQSDAIFNSIENEEADSEKDERYSEARAFVVEHQKASTSFLQRKLGLGYGRAAKIVDYLEAEGVVGPQNGSKSRMVLLKPEDIAAAESTVGPHGVDTRGEHVEALETPMTISETFASVEDDEDDYFDEDEEFEEDLEEEGFEEEEDAEEEYEDSDEDGDEEADHEDEDPETEAFSHTEDTADYADSEDNPEYDEDIENVLESLNSDSSDDSTDEEDDGDYITI